VGDLIFPPMVSPTLLLVAFVLAATTQKTAFGYAASLLTAYLQVRQASKVCPAEAPRREWRGDCETHQGGKQENLGRCW